MLMGPSLWSYLASLAAIPIDGPYILYVSFITASK